MKPTLVFDYDGTIHDTMVIYEPAIREICSWLLANGYVKEANPSRDRIAGWLGMNLKDMWQDFMPDLQPQIKERAGILVGQYMEKSVNLHEARWYPKAEDTLDLLKAEGYRMVILSNSRRAAGELHFKEFGMSRWFDRWYDCESFDWKPKTEIIKTVQEDYPGSLLVIGDRKSDYDAAAVIGAKFVGCLYGYGGKDELKSADYLIEKIEDLSLCAL